ncbi:MAG: M23 family metallopeptidase, partial [Patescibacteria group bacterium]
IALQAALGDANPSYVTPVTETLHEIEKNITFVSVPDYSDRSLTYVTPNVAVALGRTSLAPTEIKPEAAALVLPPHEQDLAENLQTLAEKTTAKIITNPKSELVIAVVTRATSSEQERQFRELLIGANLVSRIDPTQAGGAAALAVNQLNPVNPFVGPAAIRWKSMGANPKAVAEFVKKNPSSKIANFVHNNPSVLLRFQAQSQLLDNPANKLGPEITPPPRVGIFAGLTGRYQTLTNTVSGFLPGQAGQIFNAATHPFQFIQGKIGNFIGNQFVDKFKGWLVEKVGAKIANESFNRAAQFVLKEGLTKGIEKVASFAIAKIGGTALVAGISAAIGISTLGVGTVIQVAVMAGIEVAKFGGKVVMGILNGLSRALTGEDFDWKPIAATPLLLLGGIGGILGSLGAATSVAAMSAGVALVISALVGFFLYITVITVAPIITTIAQLDSGLGPQQGPAFGGVYEPYTGPILPGCSQIWPVSGGLVLQGPHGTYSHLTAEAVDIYVPIGTPVKSMSSGMVALTGWGDSYGNWIQVRSTSANGKSYTVIYAHLSEIGVQVGNPVGVGTVIALSGASSSVPSFANPHLHMEYRGIAYNSCPAGGVQVPDGCAGAVVGKPNACLINGKPIYTK